MLEKTSNQIIKKNIYHKDAWNNCLNTFSDRNIFQSYEWGELKKLDGWAVLRILIIDNITSENILIAQVLVKKIIGIKVAWCPGGPILKSDNSSGIHALKKFQNIIFDEHIFNLRCKPYMPNTKENQKIFSNFTKSDYSFTSSKSSILRIVDDDKFLQQVKKKHRYYIKQSEKSGIVWKICSGNDTARIFSLVYDSMKINKGLNLPIIDINYFSKILGVNKDGIPRFFSFAGFEQDDPVSVCVISLLDNKAFYHYAASTERGREIYASYGMIFNLVRELRGISIDELDFGGISTDESSTGVDFFKLGFNGEDFLKVGELDISKNKLYSYLFSKILQLKTNIKG